MADILSKKYLGEIYKFFDRLQVILHKLTAFFHIFTS